MLISSQLILVLCFFLIPSAEIGVHLKHQYILSTSNTVILAYRAIIEYNLNPFLCLIYYHPENYFLFLV